MSDVRSLSALDWASEIATLSSGESRKLPATVISLRFKHGEQSGYLPLLMPTGTYIKGMDDDLITFLPDQEAAGRQ